MSQIFLKQEMETLKDVTVKYKSSMLFFILNTFHLEVLQLR